MLEAMRIMLALAESVLVSLDDAPIMSLVRTLRDHPPGAELVLYRGKPFEFWLGNRCFARSRSPFAGLTTVAPVARPVRRELGVGIILLHDTDVC